MLKTGKLYKVEDVYFLLYPDIPSTYSSGATSALCSISSGIVGVRTVVELEQEYWSCKLNKTVGRMEPGVIFLVLTVREGAVQIVAGEQVGWIIPLDWMKFKEVA